MTPYLLAYGNIAIIAAFIATAIGYQIALKRTHARLAHWRQRAIDLSLAETERRMVVSERISRGNRTRAAKRRVG